MSIVKRFETIYHDGEPEGIKYIRRPLSSMVAYCIPRDRISEAKKLMGIHRPGIYYLINEMDEGKLGQIYIGQTRNGISRIEEHKSCKGFWNKAIMFLADASTFSLDVIAALEAHAINEAQRYACGRVENFVNPRFQINEYDFPLIEEIYGEILFIMGTLGYKIKTQALTCAESLDAPSDPRIRAASASHTPQRPYVPYSTRPCM